MVILIFTYLFEEEIVTSDIFITVYSHFSSKPFRNTTKSQIKIKEQTQQEKTFPSVHIMLRTFAGDRRRFENIFLPSIEAFCDFDSLGSFTIILDNESIKDHEFGDMLLNIGNEKGFPFRIQYIDPPSDTILHAAPYGGLSPRESSPGYTRQLYDTFWFDKYLPSTADKENDIIGIFDVDAALVSVLTFKELIKLNTTTTTSTASNKLRDKYIIHQPVMLPDKWVGDKYILGLADNNEAYDLMSVNSFPQLLWIDTFVKCREHIIQLWSPDVPTFDQAWLNLYTRPTTDIRELQKVRTSPSNTLLNFGIYFQTGYVLNMVNNKAYPALPVFALNKGTNVNVIIGCCRVFGPDRLYYDENEIPYCYTTLYFESAHITTTSAGRWSEDANNDIANKVYDDITLILQSIPEQRYKQMKHKCETEYDWSANWKQIINVP